MGVNGLSGGVQFTINQYIKKIFNKNGKKCFVGPIHVRWSVFLDVLNIIDFFKRNMFITLVKKFFKFLKNKNKENIISVSK